MKQLLVLMVLSLGATAAHGHFIWIIPDDAKKQVRIVMSETPTPDDPALLDKIVHTQVHIRDANGKVAALAFKKGEDSLEAGLSTEGACTVGGVCCYGVMQRGKSDPFLLMYHAKTYVFRSKSATAKNFASTPWERLALEIMLNPDRVGVFQVLWDGKPFADAEVTATLPGTDEPISRKTDAKGNFSVDIAKPGLCGFRVRHVEPKAGVHDGKAYKEVRYYSTLVVRIGS